LIKSSLTSKKEKGADYLLIISVLILSVIGTVFIYSASNYSAEATYGDPYYFVKKQVIGICLGIIAMIFTANVSYDKLKKFTLPVSVISFISLALVFVPGIGVENYGAKRWIGFGGLTLQPSEIAKLLPRQPQDLVLPLFKSTEETVVNLPQSHLHLHNAFLCLLVPARLLTTSIPNR
jgi:cell division protein FtsW (lipid II flippase)